MKHLKKFSTHSEYRTFAQGASMIKPNVSRCVNEIHVHYNKDYARYYLTLEVVSGGTIEWSANNTGYTRTISYSLDSGKTWTNITSATGSSAPSINVSEGDKVLLKGSNNTYGATGNTNTNDECSHFCGTAYFNVEGNIMSLIYGDNFFGGTAPSYFNLNGVFRDSNVISAKNLELPEKTMKTDCYHRMFSNCTSLTTAPKLPATTLASGCYSYMFYGCTSLTTAPELPSTILKTYCYTYMFGGCTSLTDSPILPATNSVSQNCYSWMFNGCSNLTAITCYATVHLSDGYCTGNWVTNVSPTGVFYKNASATAWSTGNQGIPSNWTVQDAS